MIEPNVACSEWMDALAKELCAEMNTLAKRATGRSDEAALMDAATACALAAVAQCVERAKKSKDLAPSSFPDPHGVLIPQPPPV